MNNNNKNKSVSVMALVVTVSAVIGAVAGSLAVQSIFKGNSNGNVDAVLMQTADELNKQLPMTVDKYTRLDTTVAMPGGKFKYMYTVFADDNFPEAAEFETNLKPKLVNMYETSDDMKQMRDVNATLVYSYFLEDGTEYTSFEIPAGKAEDTTEH